MIFTVTAMSYVVFYDIKPLSLKFDIEFLI